MTTPTAVSWLAYLLIGGVAGWLANRIMGGNAGILINLVTGVVGGFLGGLLLGWLGVDVDGGHKWFTFFVALGGAILLLSVVGVLGTVRRR